MGPRRRLVLGLGSPLAGDDGFGPAVVARLRGEGERSDGIELRDAGTDLLAELDTFANYEAVVLVDAAIEAGPVGEVTVVDEATFTTWPASSAGCHAISPLLAVKLFRRLHPGAATRITLVARHSAGLDLGRGVSAEAVTRGAAAVRHLLDTT